MEEGIMVPPPLLYLLQISLIGNVPKTRFCARSCLYKYIVGGYL